VRLFVAVNFDDATKSRLLAVQDRIKSQAVKGNFSRPENLHLTLVFIGETDAGLVPVIAAVVKNAVAVMPEQKPLTINFSETGCFRHSGKELWWISPSPDEKGEPGSGLDVLIKIREKISAGLEAAGVSFDKRPFRAHITLAREIKPSTPIVLPTETISVPVGRISLMKSEHIKGVAAYTFLP